VTSQASPNKISKIAVRPTQDGLGCRLAAADVGRMSAGGV
jgi:hypothetical protein